MEEIKKSIRRSIEKIPFESVSDFSIKNIKDITISRKKHLGMHIINSQRFTCELDLVDKNNKSVNIKIFVKSRPNVLQEFHNMKLLWDSHYFKNTKYTIPKPLFLDEKNSLLFMEFHDGQGFLNMLYKSMFSYNYKNNFSIIEKSISDAALWLTDFQSVYLEENDAVPSDLLNFKDNIKGFTSLKKEEVEKIIDKINNIIEYVPKFFNTYVHDQYLFRNIIYYGDKVCVVDFPNLRIGWPLYDFFTFYLGIDRLRQYPFISKSRCNAIKELFVNKYFEYSQFRIEKQIFDNLFFLFIIAYSRKRYKQFYNIRGYMNDNFIHQLSRRLAEWSRI